MTTVAPPPKTVTDESNPRGIPKALFIEDVDAFIGGPDGDAELALKTLQETLAKYQFMEQSSLQRRAGLEEKVPEFERTIEMVEVLRKKKGAERGVRDDVRVVRYALRQRPGRRGRRGVHLARRFHHALLPPPRRAPTPHRQTLRRADLARPRERRPRLPAGSDNRLRGERRARVQLDVAKRRERRLKGEQ